MQDQGPNNLNGNSGPNSPRSPLTLEVFVLANGHRLLAYIKKRFPPALQSRYDPLDLYQATVFEAFKQASTFQFINNEATFGWLFLLARRQIGMALRSERRSRRAGLASDSSDGSDLTLKLLQELAAYQRTPSRSAIHHEAIITLERALDSLPPHLAEAVRLRHIEKLPMARVAQMTGRTERAAATLCYRGLRILQRKLRSYSRLF